VSDIKEKDFKTCDGAACGFPGDQDHVDSIIAQWHAEAPEYDYLDMELIGRLGRVAGMVSRRVARCIEAQGISVPEFDVLAALKRSGAPYKLLPTTLYKTLMVTSGTMTHRLQKLEKAGFITREADKDDGRAMLVCLSDTGHEKVAGAIAAHIANEAKILSGLSDADKQALSALLRKLALSLGDIAFIE
jgi:DNA-binding MarR family transcriptional regulator